MFPPLTKKQIDVWLLPIDGWDFTELGDSLINNLLSKQEQLRFERFRPATKKAEFLASRLLLRHLLTQYTECDPSETEAIPNDMGRPFWEQAGNNIDLFFSLSHTKDMICCALSRNKEIGCDIESLQPRKYQDKLTEQVFSQKEQTFYKELPTAVRSEFFYRSWTLKESFIKAQGQGLRIPLTSLSFTYRATDHGIFTVSPKHLGNNWTTIPYGFQSSLPVPGYALGIATPIAPATINTFYAGLTGKTVRLISKSP
jgi:4'-phosphopantetheinyl transferase